jgi:menaquinone-dependent protoporphyrinogen oxidase
MSVLVAIASAHNATREIGDRIAVRLRAHIAGTVDVVPVAEVKAGSVAKYSAVLVGSAIHMGGWISAGRQFIHREHATLAARPVWAFSVGAPPNPEAKASEEASVEKTLRKSLPELKGHTLFMGRIEKDHLPWVMQLIFSWFPNSTKFGDFREWEAIDEWADKVGMEMKAVINK